MGLAAAVERHTAATPCSTFQLPWIINVDRRSTPLPTATFCSMNVHCALVDAHVQRLARLDQPIELPAPEAQDAGALAISIRSRIPPDLRKEGAAKADVDSAPVRRQQRLRRPRDPDLAVSLVRSGELLSATHVITVARSHVPTLL
jgi:hypothetical protein